MSYFLGVIVVLWALVAWLYKSTDRPGDDFGAAFPLLVLGVIAGLSSLVYLGMAFWLHRFI